MSNPRAGTEPRVHAVVPCAGIGSRAGAGGPKQYALLAGRPMVEHTLRALCAVRGLSRIVVALSPGDQRFAQLLSEPVRSRVNAVACGGPSRAATVAAALCALRELGAEGDDWVLVHDAARCLVQAVWIEQLMQACQADAVGGLLALPVADTLKQVGTLQRAERTVPRADLWAAQTPQMFRLGLLQRALAQAGDMVTDEASAIEHLGLQPLLVRGDARNIKLTWPEDFVLAKALLTPQGSDL